MSELPPSQSPSAAEQRLLALLVLLRRPAEGADPSLTGSVMRRVRIQLALRELLGAVGGLTRAVEDVFRVLARSTRREHP